MFQVSYSMKKGFTLIEILVTSSIIVILAAILVANFPGGGKQFALQQTAHKLIQDLRKAQEMAMSAKEESCAGGEANGFGIHFEMASPNSYTLFANCDAFYDYDSGIDKDLQNIPLETGIKILNLSADPSDIVFAPPGPATYINHTAFSTAQIIISVESDTSKTKIIRVNSSGLIEIK